MQSSFSSGRLVTSRSRRTTATLALVGLLTFDAAHASAGPASVQLPSERRNNATVQSTIAEASRRFGVPERWIVEVMQVESHGVASAVSPAGAIGLMQVMPSTYAALAARYGLGPSPYDPCDNILAGAAYLREMYDRYGTPGFLAAYNAGPGRWEAHLSGARRLPDETLRYLARLGPVVDASASPVPAFAGRASAPSPLSAPIFVALGVAPAPVQGAAEREGIVRVIAANTTVVGRPDAIFVARSPQREGVSSDAGRDGQATEQPRSDDPHAATPLAGAQALNPLFAPRSGSGESR